MKDNINDPCLNKINKKDWIFLILIFILSLFLISGIINYLMQEKKLDEVSSFIILNMETKEGYLTDEKIQTIKIELTNLGFRDIKIEGTTTHVGYGKPIKLSLFAKKGIFPYYNISSSTMLIQNK